MAAYADPSVENASFRTVAATFALLFAVAWVPLSGVAIAIAIYGAALLSGHLCQLLRRAGSSRQRLSVLLGLVVTWIVVLACAGTALPSNLSRVLLHAVT